MPMRRIAALTLVLLILCSLLVARHRLKRPAENMEETVAPNAPAPVHVMARLRDADWDRFVSDGLGLWVSEARQELIGIQCERVLFVYPCSTAAKGLGNRANSFQTPLGWHVVAERFGDGLPVGAVFKERKYTGRAWTPGNATNEDLILTRILWLRGLEPGVNAGQGVDSYERYIYIHGTPEEDKLGTPASLGCIRLSNSDVIALFEQAQIGTRVLVTEW